MDLDFYTLPRAEGICTMHALFVAALLGDRSAATILLLVYTPGPLPIIFQRWKNA